MLGVLAPLFLATPLVQRLDSAAFSVTGFSAPTTALQCAFPGLTVHTVFYVYMLLPLVSLVIGALAIAYDSVAGCCSRRHRPPAAGAPPNVSFERAVEAPDGPRPGKLLITAVSVLLLFLYPTLAQKAVQMHDCVQYDLGPSAGAAGACGTRHLLRDNHGVDCLSPEHRTAQRIGSVLAVVYGLGVPVLLPLLALSVRRACDEPAEMDAFAFLFAGFKKVPASHARFPPTVPCTCNEGAGLRKGPWAGAKVPQSALDTGAGPSHQTRFVFGSLRQYAPGL